jgi:PhnB protein
VVKAIPDGFHSVTPYLIVRDGAGAIEYYKKAFGAVEVSRHACEQTGKILNAQLRIGSSIVMLNDEFPEFGALGPAKGAPLPVKIHLYVEDVDAVFDRAVKAGGEVVMPVAVQFWGDRYGEIRDPYGHAWSIATHVEDVTPEQMAERASAAFAQTGQP